MSFRDYRVQPFAGHKKTVNYVAWNVNGDRLASGSSDFSARIWSVKSGALVSTLELNGHKKSVKELAWDPSKDNVIATAGSDKTVRIWDTRAAKCAAVVETKGENINITFSRDGSHIVVGNSKDVLSWIDARTHKVVFEKTFPSETNEIAFDITGELLFATTGAGTVDIYQGEFGRTSFKRVMSLPAHASSCYSISFSSDGNAFAVSSADSLVSIWDRHELVCSQAMTRLRSPVRTTCFSHDSLYLASGGEDGIVDVTTVLDGSQAASFKASSTINCIAWNPISYLMAYVTDRNDANRSHDSGSIFLLGPSKE